MAKKRKARSSEQQQPLQPIPQPEHELDQGQQPEEEEEQPIVEQANLGGEQVDKVQEPPCNLEENDQEDMVENENDAAMEAQHEELSEIKEEVVEPVDSTGEVEPDKQDPPPEANGKDEEKAVEGDNEDKELEDEPLENILEPFSKEQLVVLLKEAISKHPEFIESVRKQADAIPAHRKIFVHGLGWDATAETLTSVFGQYGEIEDCKAVYDKISGKSKGYGFILFKHRSGARKALEQPQKKIGNRMTSCQLASAGPVPAPPPTAVSPPVSEYTQRKIFVSNVSADFDPKKLLEFFLKFGEIEEGPLGLDKQTGKPKGFALFVYKSVEGAKKALEEPNKVFDGHTLHCQKAIDGPKTYKQTYFQQHHNQQQHSQYHHHPSKKGKYSNSSASGSGNVMSRPGPAVGFNPAATTPSMNPAIGQALNALTALTQGGGLGINNLMGGIGAPLNQGGPSVMSHPGYGNQGIGGYGNQPGMLGGYQNPQLGQGNARMQPGGPPYMGHGH